LNTFFLRAWARQRLDLSPNPKKRRRTPFAAALPNASRGLEPGKNAAVFWTAPDLWRLSTGEGPTGVCFSWKPAKINMNSSILQKLD